ncbi:hypothetical protein DSC91_000469 [Paraburkholderia caffeinilytica]|jgi:hypothetical protein|uniref:Uncharacterized protein n=1 Tax=Paraburkholderia caffeinilytica TaxID=1761016 RepID=A0ABQ1N5P8_9BURK|nr:hypothetical protein [Paraburkholderia caffeinilytica]AXL48885.1 hypothetical protein DSC91_000469 [Paraburkholderia caffeinilytica]GGC54516.1 hypothetical protein GCM10011400_47730 [Paraburkholderia caffeinilytica]CAB3784850.1 hypothetical protein LMG28690_01873 [Paraburkholderia caffeinilytica]
MSFRLKCFGKALLVLVGIAVLGWMVMALWNWVVPALFIGGRSIDYLHAMGLLVLSRILFGGFRGHGGCHGRRHWRRWERMTPEERENFQKSLSSADGKRPEDRT